MTKERKRVSFALILCILILCPILLGAAPSHTDIFYVNDYADVLSDETESHILSTAVELENQTTAQVVVLTVNSLDGEEISDYAVETFRNWGIGDEENNNGVLIVLSVDDREMWVTTGYGVEGTLTDTRLGQLRDTYAIPYYQNDDFDTGTKALFNAIVNELCTEEYGIELSGDLGLSDYSNQYDSVELPASVYFGALFFVGLSVCLPGGIRLFQIIKYLRLLAFDKKNGTNTAAVYRNKCKQKRIFTTYGPHHRGGGGFGGFGGGFGGGGFRGGGGSSGGGGAGGGF